MDGNFNNGNNEQNPYGQYSSNNSTDANNTNTNNTNGNLYENGSFYQNNTSNTGSTYQSYTNQSQQFTPYQEPAYNGPQEDNTTLPVISLILGILSIVSACCYGGGILFGIGGWVCAAIANKKSKTSLGSAGLITSIVGTVLSALMIILFIVIIIIGVAAEM